jgi:hypothetical protein
MESTFESRRLSEFKWRHLVRTYRGEFAEISVLPEAEYWRVVAARMQTQDTERNLIKELVPSEWASTQAASRRFVQQDHHEQGASRSFPARVRPYDYHHEFHGMESPCHPQSSKWPEVLNHPDENYQDHLRRPARRHARRRMEQ